MNCHIRAHLVRSLLPAALLLTMAASAAQAAPSALELMRRSDKQHRLASERTESTMWLQSKGDKPQQRQLSMLIVQDDKAGDRMLLRFSAPPNIKDTALLSIEDTRGGDDEQWLYLPAFRRTRRVGTAELGDRFVGTDLFYEDMKRREVDDFSYTMLRSEKLDGHDCWVIESKPSAPKVVKESPYGKSVTWLRKDNLMPVRVRSFDRKLRPLKELRVEQPERVSGKAWRAKKATMVDIQRQHRTVLVVDRREVNLKVAADAFSKHRLGK